METQSTILSSEQTHTVVLVTNQFQCERLIKAGRAVADISRTELVVLNVQSTEFPTNPEAIQYLFNISSENDAVMNLLYSENTFKTIIKYIKQHKTSNVVTGLPSKENSILHQLWRRFTYIRFFTVDEKGELEEVMDREPCTSRKEENAAVSL